MKAEDIFEDLEILILQNEDDFDRGSGKFILRKFIKEKQAEQLIIADVVKTLPTIIEIDFDGHLKCQIETTDKAPTILKAVNGYGQSVDCNKDKIRINEI